MSKSLLAVGMAEQYKMSRDDEQVIVGSWYGRAVQDEP